MRSRYLVALAALALCALVAVPCWAQDQPPAVADPEPVAEAEAVEPEPAAEPEAEAVEPEPVAEPEAEAVVEAAPAPAPEPVAEVEPEPAPEPEPTLTSVETGAALQDALAAHASEATGGQAASTNVARLAAELLAAQERSAAASSSMDTSAATVFAAYAMHIATLQGENEAELTDLRAAQANFAP